MKRKRVIICGLLLMFISIAGVKAQNQLNILDGTGETTSYELAEIKKLIFSDKNLVVEQKMGTTESFELDKIGFLSFKDINTGVEMDLKMKDNHVLLYPNPAKHEINVSFDSMKQGNFILEIFDLNGKILIQRKLKNLFGNEIVKINISHLYDGLYLCRIKGNNTIKTTKFYKN